MSQQRYRDIRIMGDRAIIDRNEEEGTRPLVLYCRYAGQQSGNKPCIYRCGIISRQKALVMIARERPELLQKLRQRLAYLYCRRRSADMAHLSGIPAFRGLCRNLCDQSVTQSQRDV